MNTEQAAQNAPRHYYNQGHSSDWVARAIEKINADFNRSADTHLVRLTLPAFPDIEFYLKDESTHPSGSLKHRLARSLFLYGLCNGKIGPETMIIEASSGSTAISEAYFARLLGLKFMAVIPQNTAPEKIKQIEFYGGRCHMVHPKKIYEEAEAMARRANGYYMDQFTFAERATDWRGNNNIAESLFSQMQRETHPLPEWVVASAGTGGTSATLGRYIRYCPELMRKTKLCVVDPDNSVFASYFDTGDASLTLNEGSRIEGIGRPRVEPSFVREVIDRMISIPDSASIATIWWLEEILGRKFGASTGTNFFGCLLLAHEMKKQGIAGSIATLICDPGERYLETYFNQQWILDKGLTPDTYKPALSQLMRAPQ